MPPSYPPTSPLLKKPGSAFHSTVSSVGEYDVERTQARLEKMYPTLSSTRRSTWGSSTGTKGQESDYGYPLEYLPDLDAEDPTSNPAPGTGTGSNPRVKDTGLYDFLAHATTFTRWTLFVIPVLGLIWIPGLLSISTFPDARIWGVRLLWWSIWLTIAWAGWWGILSLVRIIPIILKWTLGAVAASTKKYIDWTAALYRYITLFTWTMIIWISWHPLISIHLKTADGSSSQQAITVISRLLFAFYLCSGILLFEKFSIQWIAGKFHEKSYAERIEDQTFAIKSLAVLYQFSKDVPDPGSISSLVGDPLDVQVFQRRAPKSAKAAKLTGTVAFRNMVSEVTPNPVPQPNNPIDIITKILQSPDQTTALARRIFLSFAQPNSDYFFVNDITRCFRTLDEAEKVFALFDKDSNGDASQEEVQIACLEFYREQMSIDHSMRDLDSAVGRLDNILMTVYVAVAVVIIATALEAKVFTVVAGTSTMVLGLSWLIGGTMQEILASIIFLFIKHPYDVGDRIEVNGLSYSVKEIRLLSTVLLDCHHVYVQVPHSLLNTLFISNERRSPQYSEVFTFDVWYKTTFEDLENLREKMMRFVKSQKRDYQPVFDVMVYDFPGQEKLTLTAEIMYKSNSQQGAVKARRRNRWLCALKAAMAETKIYGPKGNPNAPPAVTRVVNVPWEEAKSIEAEVEISPEEAR